MCIRDRNIGPNKEDILTVQEVVTKAISIWGSGKYKAQVSTHNPHEAGILKLDCARAKKVLGWKPMLNADSAISKTIEWYRVNHANPAESKAFTIKQIMEYANDLNNVPTFETVK